MGKFYEEIPEDGKLVEFIRNQKLFHVASAPLKGGHINVSPRGYQCFKLVNRKACWFLDLAGSGNETISHLYEPGNGRITIMFEAFEGPPNIVRLYGKGTVYEKGTPEFEKLFSPSTDDLDEYDFPTPELLPGARAVIWIDITHVGTSCGFGVPFMQFVKERDQLNKFSSRLEENDAKTEDPYSLGVEQGMKKWTVMFNTWSNDGLPGLKREMQSDKYDPEAVRGLLTNLGLKNVQPPGSQGSSTATKSRTEAGGFSLILFGIALGITFMTVAQRYLPALVPAWD